jgi:hypothetical protein
LRAHVDIEWLFWMNVVNEKGNFDQKGINMNIYSCFISLVPLLLYIPLS